MERQQQREEKRIYIIEVKLTKNIRNGIERTERNIFQNEERHTMRGKKMI